MSHMYFANRADPTMDYYRMTTKFDQRTGRVRAYYSRNGTPITAAIGETKRPCNVPTGPFYSVEPKPVKVCNCPVSCDHLARQAQQAAHPRPSLGYLDTRFGPSLKQSDEYTFMDGRKSSLNEAWFKERMERERSSPKLQGGLRGEGIECSKDDCGNKNHRCNWDAQFDEVCGRDSGSDGKWAAWAVREQHAPAVNPWASTPAADKVAAYRKSLTTLTPGGPPPAPFYCDALTDESDCNTVAGDYCAWSNSMCRNKSATANADAEAKVLAEFKARRASQAQDQAKFKAMREAEAQAKAQAAAAAQAPAKIGSVAEAKAELEALKSSKAAMAYYGNVARRRNSLSRMSRMSRHGNAPQMSYYGNAPHMSYYGNKDKAKKAAEAEAERQEAERREIDLAFQRAVNQGNRQVAANRPGFATNKHKTGFTTKYNL